KPKEGTRFNLQHDSTRFILFIEHLEIGTATTSVFFGAPTHPDNTEGKAAWHVKFLLWDNKLTKLVLFGNVDLWGNSWPDQMGRMDFEKAIDDLAKEVMSRTPFGKKLKD